MYLIGYVTMRNVPSWYQQSSLMCVIVTFQMLSFPSHIGLLSSIIRLLITTQSSRDSHRQYGPKCLSSPEARLPEATEEYDAPLPTPLHTPARSGGTGPLVKKNSRCSRWTLILFTVRLISQRTPTFLCLPL